MRKWSEIDVLKTASSSTGGINTDRSDARNAWVKMIPQTILELTGKPVDVFTSSAQP